jgi:hypothetical protein
MTCDAIDTEVAKHQKRIGNVAKLGKARDVGIGIGTGTAIAGSLGPVGLIAIPLLAGADIDTTGEEKRIDLLWHARDRRQVAGFEGC